MHGHWLRNAIILAVLVVVGAGFWWAFKPRPVAADMVSVTRGPMTVTIEEDGETRVREIYRISAPVAGNVGRSLLEVGDPVKAGETVVATINPVTPPIIDERTRAEARARVEAARAAVAVAEAQAESARAALDLATSEQDRAMRLADQGTISESRLESARIDVDVKQAAVQSAQAQVALRKSELASARAALIQPGDAVLKEPEEDCCYRLRSPADGVILSLAVKSEQVVQAGMELATVGDPSRLEVVAELLSSDATRLKPGARATIRGWGGDPVPATLRRVDPAGFTKVSALGIEEKRVNAVLDLERPEPALGHGFRVRVALETWSEPDVLAVPIAALFRTGGDWTVFVVEDGRAQVRRVELGHMNDEKAQVRSGLEAGDTVIVYPGDQVADGVLVERR
ncbi:MAG: HlyD family efflux transporter periplasmic adaptor subunit [Zhengella sp.]|uniref:efflux RND transporter periplasmic adaptor subunit n=1 Tax=Zhengella sp. TaxID=2282762 RepID=UPI001D9050CA|nr:HlyD family efflux transporter periplasmic adaptor subunit [Notoacmeibacter sp.]MCC0026189.1 HlyD family efflux transporter periplasmic adaptor subunit [Brucellaceae bacterium]